MKHFLLFFLAFSVLAGCKSDTDPDLSDAEIQQVKAALDSVRVWRTAIQASYKDDLAACGYDSVLAPTRLTADKTLAQSREIIGCLRASRDRHDRNIDTVMSRYRALLDAITISRANVASLHDDVTKSLKKSEARNDSLKQMDHKLFAELEAIVNLLDKEKGKWRITGNEMQFDNPTADTMYARLLTNVISIGQQEEEMLARIQAEQHASQKLIEGAGTRKEY